MDKKHLEYYKKKLIARREELLKNIARTEEEGRTADDDPTVDLADKAANSYTKEFLFGQTNTDRSTLKLIDDALERIKNGTYGVCNAHCDTPSCSKSASKRCLGPAIAPTASPSRSRDCCSQTPQGRVAPSASLRVNLARAMEPAPSVVRARMRGFADALASVIFPAPCRVCNQVLAHSRRIPICDSCMASLAPYLGPACERCGRPFVSGVAVLKTQQNPALPPLCHVCMRGLYDFEFARSYGNYTNAMVRAIMLLKYEKVLPLGGWFAARLAEVAAQSPAQFAADVVVPVPVHPERLRERGYNQAELIARPMARRLGLSFAAGAMVRLHPNPEKLRLTRRERWKRARGAFAIHPGARVDNLRVLLVDDVMTTGATLDACSRVLRAAGAAKVVALVAARAVPLALMGQAEAPPEEQQQ